MSNTDIDAESLFFILHYITPIRDVEDINNECKLSSLSLSANNNVYHVKKRKQKGKKKERKGNKLQSCDPIVFFYFSNHDDNLSAA